MVAIIIAAVAVILCSIASAMWASSGNVVTSIAFGTLAIINMIILGKDINDYVNEKNGGIRTTVVHDVVDYNIDSTITIKGSDTTKTYVLTYIQVAE